jgi:hypothetical protein
MMSRQMKLAHPISLLLFAALGCGGSAKPAESGRDSSSESASPSSQHGTDTNSSAPKASDEDAPSAGAKPADTPEPSSDKATIASGLQLLDHRSLALDFDLNLLKKGEGKGIQSGSWSFSEDRTMRVRTAKKDVITELQVAYGKWEARPLLGLTYETPTNGKTYLLVSDGSNLKITRGADDHAATSDEQRAVKAEYGWVGGRSPLRQALLASKLAPGSDLGKSQELAQLILGEIPGADASQTEVSATVDKVESGARKKAILKIDAKAKVTSQKAVFALDLHGTAAVDIATGWVVAVDLAGTSQTTGTIKHPKQGELDLNGKGKVTLTRKGEFR